MKNKVFRLICLILLIFLININVSAGTLSISGGNSVYVGNSITVKVNFNNIAGSFTIGSSDSSVLSGGDTQFYDNTTANFTFQALKEGSATITVTPNGKVGDYDNDSGYTGGSRSITINVVKKQTKKTIDVNKTYDSNNYLKSLKLDGYELLPEFNKDTLEYTVVLEDGAEKVNISAEAEKSTSNIKGIGEVSVSEGVNTLEVIVTAENGNERTYKISATVNEKDPIDIKIGNDEYRVIKKKELLTMPDGYIESTVKINGFDIPTFYNEVTDITLIGLKDKEGNIILYKYDSKTGEYESYTEYSFDKMNLYIHEDSDSKYTKTTININGSKVVAYKLDDTNDYYLVFATNTSTGYEGYYLYDIKENSVQRYDTKMLEKITKEKDKYLSVVTILSSVCFFTMLFLLIEVNRDYKRKNEE